MRVMIVMVMIKYTPWNYAFLSCGHLDFESAVTAQNGKFKYRFVSSYSRSYS